jgi:hypothetical protein
LSIPASPEARTKSSWFSSINLWQKELVEFGLAALPDAITRAASSTKNEQSADAFAAEQQRIEESAAAIVWHRPSDHDPDRLADPLESIIVAEAISEHPDVVGAGALRGVILHKLIEEILTGELLDSKDAATSRAAILMSQLVSAATDEKPLPSPDEMAETALRALALPDIAALRRFLVPELAVWAARGVNLVAGRADALAIRDGKIDVAIDWKSDVNPTPTVRKSCVGQLRDYLDATGAPRGALVFLTLGEVVWVS